MLDTGVNVSVAKNIYKKVKVFPGFRQIIYQTVTTTKLEMLPVNHRV